jgi:CRP-like cAMP-binding protein
MDTPQASAGACAILEHTGFFAELSAEQRLQVARVSRLADYPQGSQMYGLGEPADDFFILVDGMVRFTIGLGNRQTHGGQILRRGEVFGWAALVRNARKRIATAQAITPCNVLAINGEQMLFLMDHDHTLGYHVMARLNELITGNLTAFASG